jgi:hypothetical protein
MPFQSAHPRVGVVYLTGVHGWGDVGVVVFGVPFGIRCFMLAGVMAE